MENLTMSRDRPVSKKASYLLARFARFFRLGLGVKGAGGVFRSRRSTSSGLGVRSGLGVAVMVGV